jgi:DNA-binding CsgD family transcriptional regulator
LLTDPFGRIAEANREAHAVLAEADGLLVRDGMLRAAQGKDNAKLARLINEAAGARLMQMSGVMQIGRPSGRRPIALVVSSSRRPATLLRFFAARMRSALLSLTRSASPRPTGICCSASMASPRQAAVVALLLRVRSPNKAADELAISQNTAHTHIRHVFDKTGVERLSDLVCLLMAGPGVRGR